MKNTITINISDLIGGTVCVTTEDGQRIFEKIKPFIEAKQKVELSFENISLIITLFLNVAIGQLYNFFSEEVIREYLSVKNITESDKELLRHVVINAKKYYKNKEGYDKAWESDGGE